MTKPRVTATNRLADVIEVVELGRRTGLLLVERGYGEMLEEGAIFFQSGRATYAAIERMRGHDALAVLGGWGGCRFSFDTEAERPAPNLAPVSAPSGGLTSGPASQSGWGSSAPSGYPGSGGSSQLGASYPTPPGQPGQPGRETSGPRSWYAPPSQSPTPNLLPNQPSGLSSPIPPSSQPSGPFGGSWPDPRSGPPPGSTNPGGVPGPSTSSSLQFPQGWPQPGAPISPPTTPTNPSGSYLPPELNTPPPPRSPARAEANLLRRPRRSPTAQDLMAVVQGYGLSRAHRTVLMLADGDHNVLDMARLSSKRIEEVQSLLGELEGHGLIYYYG